MIYVHEIIIILKRWVVMLYIGKNCELCVRYTCLGGGHMMKENSYNYGGDKKDTRLFVNIYVGWLVIDVV